MVDSYALALEDAIHIVVLRSVGELVVPVAGSTPIALDTGAEPGDELLTELLASMVRIRVDEGIPPGVLAVLRQIPVPAAFRASVWLDASRPLVLRDGVGRVGGMTVRYSDHGGLRIDWPEREFETDPGAGFGSEFDDDENG